MAIDWTKFMGGTEAARMRPNAMQQIPASNLTNSREMRDVQQTQGADFGQYQNQLNQLLQDPSKVQQTGGYQFAVDQGNQAINRSAAAKGMLNSGNVLAELDKYGQGMGAQQYDTETNRLAQLMQGAQRFGVATDYWKQPTSGVDGGGSSLSWGSNPYQQPQQPQQPYSNW